jgi:hypothetical protein
MLCTDASAIFFTFLFESHLIGGLLPFFIWKSALDVFPPFLVLRNASTFERLIIYAMSVNMGVPAQSLLTYLLDSP